MDELDAAAIGFRAISTGVGLERAFEIVDEREEIANHVRRDRVSHALPVTLDALAVIVELGRLAKEPIIEIVTLPLQFVCIDNRRSVIHGIGRGLFVLFVHDLDVN
jgi:hypothetical protein